MISIWHRFTRQAGILCTIGLLLLPVVLSGHNHAAEQSNPSDACALCVVTHFSPATTAPPLPQLAPPAVAVASAAVGVVAPTHRHQPRPSGRGPPQSLLFRAV